MTTEMIINKTIKELQEIIDDASGKLSKYNADLDSVKKALDLLNGLNKEMIGYDPNAVFELLEKNNLKVSGIREVFQDVQNIVEYYVLEGKDNIDLEEYDEYKLKIDELKNNLNLLRELIEKKVVEAEEKLASRDDVKRLNDVLDIVNHRGDMIYITEDMLKSLHKTILSKYSLEDLKLLYMDLYKTENFSLDEKNIKVIPTLDEVINLFKEYISEDVSKYIKRNKENILNEIDLDNARKILDFFKSIGIIKRFSMISIVKIATKGDYDTIVETHKKILEDVPASVGIEAFVGDNAVPVWVNADIKNESNVSSLRIITRRVGNTGDHEYPQYTVSNLIKNVQLIMSNSDLFEKTYTEKDLYNNSVLKFSYPHVLEKNIKLCRMFGLGNTSKIKISMLRTDLENKLHCAIELGLLKAPMSDEYRRYDTVATNQQFNYNDGRSFIHDDEVRNYFSNYTTSLMNFSNAAFAYYTKVLADVGPSEFYRVFFSSKRPGTHAKIDKETLNTAADIPFVDGNSVIDGYSRYSECIDNHYEDDFNGNYYDPEIINNPLIKELDEQYSIYDIVMKDGQSYEIKNEFSFNFDGRLISRYKVLRYASILYKEYGNLTKDMLLAAIIKNSFIMNEQLDKIKVCIGYERGM